MKVWYESAGDHSANLRIIGTFTSEDDSKRAMGMIEELMGVLDQPQTKSPHGRLSKEIMDHYKNKNFIYSHEAVESCMLCHDIRPTGKSIIVDTDEVAIQIFIETFINCGGKLEIYSKHPR